MRVRAGEVDSEWERCAKNDEFVQLRRLVRAGVVERAADGRYGLTLVRVTCARAHRPSLTEAAARAMGLSRGGWVFVARTRWPQRS